MKLLIISLFVVLASFLVVEAHPRDYIFCYYGSWAVYRPIGGKFTPSDIDPALCTHVGYSFFGVNDDGTVKHLDTWADLPDGLKGIEQTEALKKKNPKLKTMLVVGGWNERATKYSNIAKDAAKTQRFIDTALDLIKKFNFNGLDLDWEYPAHPGQGGDPRVDRANFVTFVQKIKAALGPKKLLFTAAVAAPESTASAAYDIPAISKELDFIHVMTYDLHGNWDRKTGLHTALKDASNPKLSVEGTINYWLQSGCPANKLVLGIGTYGQSFTLSNPNDHGVNAAAPSGGLAGPYTRQGGFLGYNEIVEKLNKKELKEVHDDSYGSTYAYNGNQWVGYDSVDDVKEKMNFALKKNLGGVMVWSIETDDFKGLSGTKFPILRAISAGLQREMPPPEKIEIIPQVATTAKPNSQPNNTPNNGGNTNSGSIVNGSFECSEGGLFRDPSNCNQYYSCDVNQKEPKGLMTCPGDLLFDDVAKTCNWPAQVQC